MILDDEPEPVLELPEASVTVPNEPVTIGSSFAADWEGPGGERDYIDIVEVDAQRVHGELSYGWIRDGNPTSLRAPGKPGSYDVRYIWESQSQRHVLARTRLEVVESEVSLIAPAVVKIGDAIDVTYTGPKAGNDYIDLVPEGYQQTSGEISYFYTRSKPESCLLYTSPSPRDLSTSRMPSSA